MSPISISTEIQYQYHTLSTNQQRFVFYNDYFTSIAPSIYTVYASPDLSSGNRKELTIRHKGVTIISGLVHIPSDKTIEEVAADEAYTRVLDLNAEGNVRWTEFRFFLACETVSFFRGRVEDGGWEAEKVLHPLYQAQEIHDYLLGLLSGLDSAGRRR